MKKLRVEEDIKEKQLSILSPSIMTADFIKLGEELDSIESAGVKYLHLDIMDGNFVPNISYGPKIISDIKKNYDFVLDAHLMVQNPENLIEDFAEAGCDYIVVHEESTTHVHRQVQYIKSLGKKAGVALNPSTPLENIEFLLDDLDLILIMSVNPGFGGQAFIPQIVDKISKANAMIGKRDIILQVDGGIKEENVESIINAGADMVVVGSAIFDGKDPRSNAKKFLTLLNG